MSDRCGLDETEAFQAMAAFLERYWQRGRSEEIAILLGSLAAQPDGRPADPALAEDWNDCVSEVVSRRERDSKSSA